MTALTMNDAIDVHIMVLLNHHCTGPGGGQNPAAGDETAHGTNNTPTYRVFQNIGPILFFV